MAAGDYKALEGVGNTLTIGSTLFKYVTLGAPGYDTSDKIDNTTLDNTEFETGQPPELKMVTGFSFSVLARPDNLAAIEAQIGVNQELHFGMTGLGGVTFWGYLKSWTPEESEKGTDWKATGEIVVTNMNGSNVETGPVYAAS